VVGLVVVIGFAAFGFVMYKVGYVNGKIDAEVEVGKKHLKSLEEEIRLRHIAYQVYIEMNKSRKE
jgi:hypothetical protein